MCGVIGVQLERVTDENIQKVRNLFCQSMIRGKHATGVTYSSVVYQLTGVAVTGKYFDKFVKTEDGWKISERVWSVIYRNTGG